MRVGSVIINARQSTLIVYTQKTQNSIKMAANHVESAI